VENVCMTASFDNEGMGGYKTTGSLTPPHFIAVSVTNQESEQD